MLKIAEKCIIFEESLRELTIGYNSRKQIIDLCLNNFLQLGFDNARYYDVLYDLTTKEKLMILVSGIGNNKDCFQTGYIINYKDSTLGKSNNGSKSQNSSSNSYVSESPNWIIALNLNKSNWVDIPIIVQDKLVGVVAVDWIDGTIISTYELRILDMIGRIISINLNTIPNELMKKSEQMLNRIRKDSDDVNQLIKNFLKSVCDLFEISISSAFEYKWDSNELIKIVEESNQMLSIHINYFPEVYSIGEFLTGFVWENEDYIGDVIFMETLINRSDPKINPASLNRHNSILGKVTSVYYYYAGRREKKYLLRFMNRIDSGVLPMSSFQKNILEKAITEFSDILDDMISEKRLENLQMISKSVTESFSDPEGLIDIIFKMINEEGFVDCAVICHAKGGMYFTHEFFSGPIFNNYSQRELLSWKEDDIYFKAVTNNVPLIIELGSMKGHNDNGIVAGFLYSVGIKSVLYISFETISINGVLMLPLNHKNKRPSLNFLRNTLKGKYKALVTYGAITGNIIQTSNSQLTVDGAKNLMAQIGHEVSSPAAELGNVAILSLLRMKDKILNELDKQHIDEEIDSIGKQMEAMDKILSLAQIVSQQNRTLQLQFRKTDLSQIIQDSISEVKKRQRTFSPDGRYREYRIVINEACKKKMEVVCDPVYIRVVFDNLLKNAVKYSFTKQAEKEMTINIFAIPQENMYIFQIKNFGLGIPTQEFEKIFRPYVRGDKHDKRKAIQGMGLGLYISRRIMEAHKGQVYCIESVPITTNENKIKNYEGYESVFEIRIPKRLDAGKYEYNWGRWD